MKLAEGVARMNERWRRRELRYWLTASAAWLVLTAFVACGARRWGWGFLLDAFVAATQVLACGGALVIEGALVLRKGLLVTPSVAPILVFEPKCLVLIDGTEAVRVPFADITGATLVFHDSFDGVRGIDDALRVHLATSADLLVASSTEGFRELLTRFDRAGRLVRVGVEGCSPDDPALEKGKRRAGSKSGGRDPRP